MQYCNVESVFWDNAETVLGNSIRNAVEKEFPWISVRPAKKRVCLLYTSFAKNSRMQLPKRWLELFGGPENETEGVQYKTCLLYTSRCV